MSELHDRAKAVIGRMMSADPDFDDCEEAASVVRELLAENERLQYLAHHRLAMFEQREALIREVQSLCQKAEDRANAAEARLRELASAEPVACVCAYEGSDGIPFSVFVDPSTARRSPPDIGEPVPLIRRPEMPK